MMMKVINSYLEAERRLKKKIMRNQCYFTVDSISIL